MKARFKLLICTLLVVFAMMSASAFAADNQTTQVYDLSDLKATITTANGDISPQIALPSGDLKNGYTVTYSNPDGSAFYVTAGTTVTFTAILDESAHVVMGYKNSSGTKTQTYDDTAKTNTTQISITTTGYYRFYLTNVSSDTITITGGSITF